jgi:hypothetical protein
VGGAIRVIDEFGISVSVHFIRDEDKIKVFQNAGFMVLKFSVPIPYAKH